MGVVYRALDRLTGQTIALKQVTLTPALPLASTDQQTDHRLTITQEFKTLASLRHPHIISVLDYGFGISDKDGTPQPYFTMDLLEGTQDIITAGRDQSLSVQVDLLIQVLYAIAYLHRRGILHRDLKPANVMVVDGQVKVLDFGLSISHEQITSSRPAGTLAYMAPEILQGEPSSEASDLYAIGIIAYELFSGQYPFDLSNVNDLLKDILTKPVEASATEIDPGLAKVLERLLAKSPQERYASAHQAMVALAVAIDKTIPRETSLIRESFLQAAKFIGREPEMSQLTSALTKTIDQRMGSAWLIGGESGVGKSRLIDEICTRALVDGAFVLRGQAIDKNSEPYVMWRDVVRRLVLQIELAEYEASVLKSFVPDLNTLLEYEIPDASALDPQATHDRLLRVVRDVLRRCGQGEQVYIVALEDLHWAESEGLALLQYLLAETRDLPLLWVASYRDDEQPELAKSLLTMQLLKLERLSAQHIAQLSESMLGAAGRQENVVDLLQRETEGNVFFMVEVARALAEDAGTLTEVGVKTLPEKVFAGGMALVIRRRLERVPSWARPLLQVAAVGGRQLDLKVLQRIDPNIDLESWLTTCSEIALLDVQDDHWRFAHDKLREGVLAELPEKRRNQLHGQMAWALELVYPDDATKAAVLTHHWRALDDPEKVAHYARLAGQQSMRSGANRTAKTFFEQALAALNQLTMNRHYKQQLIDTALDLGRAASAFPSDNVTQALLQALKLADELHDEERKARVLGSMGTFLYVSGKLGEALEYFSQCMALAEKLGIEELLPMPYGMLGRALVIAGELPKAAYLLTKGVMFAEKFNDLDLQAGSMAWLGAAQLQQSQPDEALPKFQRSIELAEQLGNPARLAATLLFVGVGYTYSGYYDEALQVLTRCLALAQEIQSHLTAYNAAGNLGVAHYELGNLDEARLYLDLSLNLAQMIGSVVGVPFFQAYRAQMDFETAKDDAIAIVEKALEVAELTRQNGIKAQVARILGTLYVRLPEAQNDKAEAMLRQSLEIARAGSIHATAAYALLEFGKWCAAQARYGEAHAALEEAQTLAQNVGMRQHLTRIQEALSKIPSGQGQAQEETGTR
jgi:tetratricopeptide (TPR) repeat protein